MKIQGFQSESFQDWIEEGKSGLSSIIFTGSCNYRCPACTAGGLVRSKEQITEEEILRRLERKKKYIDRVVICGGEPTLEQDLPDFLKKLKVRGFSVKLDTNGSNPEMLGDLIRDKLVDYVAMDVKGPASLYRKLVGLDENSRFDLRDHVEKAIGIVQTAPGYEFRTTFAPFEDKLSACSRLKPDMPEVLRWMSQYEVEHMTNWAAKNITNPQDTKWYVQKFTAKPAKEMIDPKFSKESLPPEYQETPEKLLVEYRDILRTKFPRAEIR